MTSESMIRGYKAGRFSFNVKRTLWNLSRVWSAYYRNELLPDVYVECETCQENDLTEKPRNSFQRKIHFWRTEYDCWRGGSIFKWLKIHRKVKTIQDVGLGYITLGQQSTAFGRKPNA
jgi:excinuclease ABC subunit A